MDPIGRDTASREVRHRSESGLQILASMLSAQLQRSHDPVLAAELRSALNRVVASASLQDHLTEKTDQQVDMADYLRAICNDLETLAATAPGRISVSLIADRIWLDGPDALALGLSVNELVTNALQHAYPDGRGLVSVSFGRSAGLLALRVTDCGVGRGDAAEGVGLGLVRGLARNIRGDVTITDRSPGVEVRIEFARTWGLEKVGRAIDTGGVLADGPRR